MSAETIPAEVLALANALTTNFLVGGEVPAFVRELEAFAARAILADRSTRPAEPAPEVSWHADDLAVDRFATAMKAKLAEARVKGKGGWYDETACSQRYLSDELRRHALKPDPLDVANFAMVLHQRGETIAPAPEVEVGGGEVASLWRFWSEKARSLASTLEAKRARADKAERAAFIAGRESIYGADPAYHDAAWEAYRARLRADQPAGEGGEA